MELSLIQAAKLCGRSKSTLHRAIKSGKLSAQRSDDGTYLIDASELSRTFPFETHQETAIGTASNTDGTHEVAVLKERVRALEQALERERELQADLREERDRWHRQATALIGASQSDRKRRWWPW